MKHSIRLVETKGSKREVRKLGIVSERLKLGRGTDQNIQIPDRRVPLEHSILTLKDNHVEIKANDRVTFTVNDNTSRRAELHPGDVADIAGHKIRVLIEDDILVVEIELVDAQTEPLRERFTTRLHQLNVRTRTFSWSLFLLILAGGIIIPTVGFFVGMEPLRDAP